MWGTVLKRDLLGEMREEDKFRSKEQLQEYLKSEIKKQGEHVVIKNLDVSLVEDLSELFYGCENIRTLDLSGWKTSGVKNMSSMFSWCMNLKSLNLSGWDTSNVTDMNEMFYKCTKLKSLNLSGWKTEMEDAGHMFHYCPAPYRVINNKIIKK